MPTSEPRSLNDIAQLAHDVQLLDLDRHPYQIDKTRTPMFVSGAQPCLGGRPKPLRNPETPYSYRRREQAGHTFFSSNSKPLVTKSKSTRFGHRRADGDVAQEPA